MPVKNAVAKSWAIAPSSDGIRWSAWPAGDKYGGSGASGPNIPVIFNTDLTDGTKTGGLNNNGVWVTLFVKNAGATRGTGKVTLGGGEVASYFFWSDTKIIVQLGNNVTTGNFVVQNNDGLSSSAGGCIEKPPDSTNDFTVRSQQIFFIAPTGTNGNGAHDTPLVQAMNRIRDNFVAGAIYIFRGGTYNQQLVVNGWGNNVLNLGGAHSGAANAHTAFVAYPGEAVTLQIAGVSSIYLRDGNETVANYTTFANFILRGQSSCFGGGAQTSAGQQLLNSGGQRVRLVNCDMRALSTGNTMTGIVSIGGNGARLHQNKLHDTGYPTDATVLNTGFDPPYFNNNHAIYIQCGASDVVVSDNDLRDLNMGATVQIHTDRFFPYYGVHIRRNKFIQRASTATHQARGIVAGDISGDSWGSIVDNVFDGIGTDGPFPPIAIYSGTWKIHNNTIYNCPSGVPLVLLSHQVSSDTNYVGIETWSPPHLDMRNNIMHSAGGGPYYAFGGSGTPGGLATSAQITAANNLYSGAGAGPSFDATKVDAAHGMTDPANENYTLTLGSAARNAGTAAGLDSTALIDRFGVPRPQGAAPDIGAHEYI